MVKNERQVMMQLDEAGLSMGDFQGLGAVGKALLLLGAISC
jgi:hypothetical protein